MESSATTASLQGRSTRKKQQRNRRASTNTVERQSEQAKQKNNSLSPLLIVPASTGAAAFNYRNLIFVTAIIFGERH